MHFLLKKNKKKLINSTDYLVAKDKIKKETPMLSEVAQNFLSENKGKKKKRQCVIHRTCHLLYCMFRQAMHLHKKDNYTFSRAGLLPPPPSFQTQTDEITERQTAVAHSVCRVYMTMLK